MNLICETKLAQKGSKKAFCSLIQYYEKEMYIVAKSILHNETDCCDAVQETILKAFENIAQLKQPEYFRTWLLKILVNNCNQIYRKNHKVILINEANIESIDPDEYSDIEARQVLDGLEEDLKTVVILFYFDDLPVKTISQVLDIPEGTVKSRLSRARTQLSKILSREKGRSYYEQHLL